MPPRDTFTHSGPPPSFKIYLYTLPSHTTIVHRLPYLRYLSRLPHYLHSPPSRTTFTHLPHYLHSLPYLTTFAVIERSYTTVSLKNRRTVTALESSHILTTSLLEGEAHHSTTEGSSHTRCSRIITRSLLQCFTARSHPAIESSYTCSALEVSNKLTLLDEAHAYHF